MATFEPEPVTTLRLVPHPPPEPMRPYEPPPPPHETTPLERIKSKAKRAIIGGVLPHSVLVTHARPKRRVVALTFDDGPDELSPQYLDACEALGIRATFFLLGCYVERARHMPLEYVRRGHEVASHAYSHRRFHILTRTELVDELSRTAALLPPGLAPRPFVRPAAGYVTPGTIVRTAAAGYTTVLWSLDSDDCRTEDPAAVRAHVARSKVKPGEIILFHEHQPWTLLALPGIVSDLRAKGFEFVTLSELLGY